ncbi:cytochrome d ubiquinol oxidase subunit II [Pseudonocardia sp. KRD-184]|uniref:Cytochrome d ubiquinol oxidase subunit II n=1 Tax=Pseudonocardia oceani TaxID=2792013 RepID=A0ABS6U796_9PSEU|nr:cytochrome d ubiquinol oxidase subunit II [Pseudonocardia oceani]MBW0091777.1 cytochrome d ubiquinol oxidase subunit II [Pseudonocardia oceani]MBW0099060.1 cytochrome d ubiquinol oxidase subunit II [Pseudonocardia oceani]MBW0111386.1 cytochrome d ubiquinol oxidase subunit II [Pseudonocardia oceani]MBW0120891.1 cytochrome d ubiquinol oxidase subunit II [Pseudonocardia oceani]MBW0128102.1 cytochrome d ubiquinol oxidase subunit II [Pseudonocardia oceani]
MNLADLWFWLLAATFVLYFFLEGFDFGVDMLRPVLARTEAEERALTGTIGPFWDGNEVWVLAAAGIMFSTFPIWYGALFSGMYPLFVLILLSLLLRGVSFEYRNQVDQQRWRDVWDWLSFAGSAIPSFLWGVILAKIIEGLPLTADVEVIGGIGDLFTSFSLVGGAATLLLFVLHGANFLLLRLHVDTDLHARARTAALRSGALATVAILAFVVMGYVTEGLFASFGVLPWVFPLAAAATLATIWFALVRRRDALAFVMSGLTIVFSTVTVFLALFTRGIVLPSTLDPAASLTLAGSASQHYTLVLMTVVGAIFLPLIIGYQAWNYYVFRERIRPDEGSLAAGY